MASESDPAIKLHVVYERVRGTGLPEDVAVTTHHFTPLSDPWPTDAAHTYTTVETALNAMFAGMKTDGALFGAMTKTKEYRWYRSDDWDQKYGPVVRVAAAGALGGSATGAECPPQCAVAVTEYTGHQEVEDGRVVRHWGRFYLPGILTAALATDGSLLNNKAAGILARVETMYNAATAAGLQPVVPLTEVNQTGGVGGGTIEVPVLGTVEELRVDGVVDIIRRRRFESRGYRLVVTPNSPDLP